jgi:glycosyltransferase involved in cell wall biosynthesis
MPTGFGRQCALLAQGLAALDHEVTVSAFAGLQGAETSWSGHRVLPGGQAMLGDDILPFHARAVKADLVIFLGDAWASDPERFRDLRQDCAVASWVPIDCNPVSVKDAALLAASGVTPVAMSRFGQRMLQDAGFSPLYVPHSVDTRVFAPPPDREAVRRKFGVGGRWVIGISAANNDGFRKGFGEQFEAFRRFRRVHPEALLLVHSLIAAPGGLNLAAMADRIGITDGVVFSDQYAKLAGLIGPADLAEWYGACDVLSNCGYGEGFGLAIIEAQSCGTPVAVTDCSAMTELCGSGWRVRGQPFWNEVFGSWWTAPSITGIVRAWEKAYAATHETGPDGLPPCRVKARKFALRYDADRVLRTHWEPVLRDLAGATSVTPHVRDELLQFGDDVPLPVEPAYRDEPSCGQGGIEIPG